MIAKHRVALLRDAPGEACMELTLTSEEHELLVTILEQHHRALMKDIWHADHREFKQLLRHHEQLVEAMLSRLRVSTMNEAHVAR